MDLHAAKISKLVNEAFPKYLVTAKEGEYLRRFLVEIDPHMKLKVNEFGATTCKEAIDIAGRIERAADSAGEVETPRKEPKEA